MALYLINYAQEQLHLFTFYEKQSSNRMEVSIPTLTLEILQVVKLRHVWRNFAWPCYFIAKELWATERMLERGCPISTRLLTPMFKYQYHVTDEEEIFSKNIFNVRIYFTILIAACSFF
jgi:hypothetical protein